MKNRLLLVYALLPVAAARDCSVGGQSLCSCSELLAKHLLSSMEECTQEAAMRSCRSGLCAHEELGVVESNSTLTTTMKLRYSYHNDIGPFDMSWDFPNEDTIEIEFSLPSEFYVGIGFTADGVGDAVAAWVNKNGNVHVGDYWDAGSREPETDESRKCRNDIETVSGQHHDGVTTVRFRRQLDTGDQGDCDAKIGRGPMDINYAWCDSPWCADADGNCKGYEGGCLDSPHSLDASNIITVDFSGKGVQMLATDLVV